MTNNNSKQGQYTTYERDSQLILALNSEMLIPENAPVRLLSDQLKELDYTELYDAYSPIGRKSAVEPRVLFKVLVYGYQCGIYSSRKLEEACRYRIDFMWLLDGYKIPDHSTLARFRTKRCMVAIGGLFYQFVRKLDQMGETDPKVVFIDGTKIESFAGRYTFVWRKNVEKQLPKVKEKVETLTGVTSLSRAEIWLREQEPNISFVHGKGKRKSEEQRQWETVFDLVNRWKMYIHALEGMGEGRNSYSKTDESATFMRLKEDHMRNGQLRNL